MTRPLYLHFGPHKTGTTSIQHYLRRNRRAVASKGITVVRNVQLDGDRLDGHQQGVNCYQLAHLILRPELETIARRRELAAPLPPETIDRLLGEINAELHASPTEAVLITSESFSFLRTDAERAALDRLTDGFEVRPIGFFREKEAWMASWRRQVLDNVPPRAVKTDAPGTIFDFSAQSWLLDYDALRHFYGPRGHYLSYDDALAAHGTVIPDFLACLGLDPKTMPRTDRIWLNTTKAADALKKKKDARKPDDAQREARRLRRAARRAAEEPQT